jgi:hypothetical protein
MIRNRPAPKLSRSAISRFRTDARASRRLAIFAHAMVRISPTSVSRIYRGFENLLRRPSRPPDPSLTTRVGTSSGRRFGSALRAHSENGPASAACACAAVTPERKRAIGTTQSYIGSR